MSKEPKYTLRDRLLEKLNFYCSNKFGIWIQCSECKKWRKCFDYEDTEVVRGVWTCSMQVLDDGKKGSCENPEESGGAEDMKLDYMPGYLVWAKLQGYPWWPGIVDEDPDIEYFWKEEKGIEYYNVTFLDEEVSRSWIAESNIRSYACPPKEDKCSVSETDSRNYSSALAQAKKAAKMTPKERLRKYSFIVLYKGEWPLLCKDVEPQDPEFGNNSPQLCGKEENNSNLALTDEPSLLDEDKEQYSEIIMEIPKEMENNSPFNKKKINSREKIRVCSKFNKKNMCAHSKTFNADTKESTKAMYSVNNREELDTNISLPILTSEVYNTRKKRRLNYKEESDDPTKCHDNLSFIKRNLKASNLHRKRSITAKKVNSFANSYGKKGNVVRQVEVPTADIDESSVEWLATVRNDVVESGTNESSTFEKHKMSKRSGSRKLNSNKTPKTVEKFIDNLSYMKRRIKASKCGSKINNSRNSVNSYTNSNKKVIKIAPQVTEVPTVSLDDLNKSLVSIESSLKLVGNRRFTISASKIPRKQNLNYDEVATEFNDSNPSPNKHNKSAHKCCRNSRKKVNTYANLKKEEAQLLRDVIDESSKILVSVKNNLELTSKKTFTFSTPKYQNASRNQKSNFDKEHQVVKDLFDNLSPIKRISKHCKKSRISKRSVNSFTCSNKEKNDVVAHISDIPTNESSKNLVPLQNTFESASKQSLSLSAPNILNADGKQKLNISEVAKEYEEPNVLNADGRQKLNISKIAKQYEEPNILNADRRQKLNIREMAKECEKNNKSAESSSTSNIESPNKRMKDAYEKYSFQDANAISYTTVTTTFDSNDSEKNCLTKKLNPISNMLEENVTQKAFSEENVCKLPEPLGGLFRNCKIPL